MPLKSRLGSFIFTPENIFPDVKKLSEIRLIYTKARVDVKKSDTILRWFSAGFRHKECVKLVRLET